GIGLSDSEPRKGMPSPQLDRESFRARFLAQFRDPAFASLAGELERVADVAWDAYSNNRKSPRTRKAGPEFADPDYELSEDWLATREAIIAAQRRHDDSASAPRILIVNGSSRSEHSCPGEMSKSYRLVEIAAEIFRAAGSIEL